MKAYIRRWKSTLGLPYGPEFDVIMRTELSRKAVDWFLDELSAARLELDSMEAHYEAELKELRQRVKDLEARFIQDSHNSHQPSSQDGLKKKIVRTRSLREKTGRSSGAQPRHPAHFREQQSANEFRLYPLDRCARCGRELRKVALVQHELRQVIDLYQGKRWIIEHRAEMKRCPQCGSMNHAGFPAEASGYVAFGPEVKRIAVYLHVYQLIPPLRVCEIFENLYQLKVSEGVIHHWAVQTSQKLKPWENQTKKALIHSPLAHFDETGMRVRGKLQWLHTSGNSTHTLYLVHKKRGTQALSKMGILADFKGIAVHDGWSAYWTYSDITHALCNAHHLRELTFVYEYEGESSVWADDMKRFLQNCLHHLHRMQAQGKKVSQQWMRVQEQRYDQILSTSSNRPTFSIEQKAIKCRAGKGIS